MESNLHKASGEWTRFTDDVEELISRVSHLGDADVARIRSKVEASLADARANLSERTEDLQGRASRAATVADEYAHESPWAIAGVAALAGVAMGLVMSRR